MEAFFEASTVVLKKMISYLEKTHMSRFLVIGVYRVSIARIGVLEIILSKTFVSKCFVNRHFDERNAAGEMQVGISGLIFGYALFGLIGPQVVRC